MAKWQRPTRVRSALPSRPRRSGSRSCPARHRRHAHQHHRRGKSGSQECHVNAPILDRRRPGIVWRGRGGDRKGCDDRRRAPTRRVGQRGRHLLCGPDCQRVRNHDPGRDPDGRRNRTAGLCIVRISQRPYPDAGVYRTGSNGRIRRISVPAGVGWTRTRPAWLSAIWRTIDRPRPEPGFERAAGER